MIVWILTNSSYEFNFDNKWGVTVFASREDARKEKRRFPKKYQWCQPRRALLFRGDILSMKDKTCCANFVNIG
jgi:hypothetical protein